MQPNQKNYRLPKTKGKESFAGFRSIADLTLTSYGFLSIDIGDFVSLHPEKGGFYY